jgi:acyl-CoA thioesterase
MDPKVKAAIYRTTDGTIAVGLNVNVTYVASPAPGVRLRAEARAVSRTRKTAIYDLRVTDGAEALIATCQALAYRTGKPIPFAADDGNRAVSEKTSG